ncbi:MAG: asparagine synthase (glutamine-hydrolyzing) [Acidobacteria bacterium]|nr:asparagine synthase (glutamine-hydrolyzing) [Acidobacteriota bacterium]
MCGIAGYLTREPGVYPDSLIRRMTGAMVHRGPDGEGVFQDEHCALGHRRLSIVDLAAGAQPMGNEDDRLQVTYNGEIYNHAKLRPDLEAAGHRYKTRCDTETILHAYEQYGPACVERFRGMFAFAIWDRDRRRLFAARDRLGIKPFYYWFDGRTFVFGSEIKALLEHPAVRVELEESELAEYLALGYSSGERTLFRGVKRLMPGHTLELSLDGALDIRQYWDVPLPSAIEKRSAEDWIEDCRARFERSVEQRLMADVPLGMFLSGGVDSGSVAAVIKRLADGPVKTFSVGYAEQEYSELEYARQVAERIGTDHHEVRVSADDFFGALPELIWHEDEPIVWPSSVALHFVSKLAEEQVKVVLTGEGADELFAGYGRYRFYLMNERWAGAYGAVPAPLRRMMRGAVETSSLLRADMRRKLGHTILGRETSFESLYIDNFQAAFSAREQGEMLQRAADAGDAYASYLHWWRKSEGARPLQRLLYTDMKTYLPELLMKQDQMSMSASIESRVPFLDHSFVEFAAQVPDEMKLHGATGKYIFKKVAEKLIPHDIIYRKKMGFPTPLASWLRGPMQGRVREILLADDGFVHAYLERGRVQGLLDAHASGAVDATDRIWRLLNMQIWGATFLDGRGKLAWSDLAETQAAAR